ncbi:hypothetical protein JGH11_13640 [Dysgonomonas sp. Marseille-P4677]|uniref:hypothetical protein n=1 Tax=Dysgonomonas sp. Marseille-P4677 TaxID=2364790 RepID=UPI00191389C6|nr:hypothetical protein [Dysgonomonas sp. Marseille-P4677]MBK5721917.1 hypothetical protein [Dysgonomonas sp. Marseille-P4677]
MGKSGLYPVCLMLMIGSCILYQFLGNPLDYSKLVIASNKEINQHRLSLPEFREKDDAVSTLQMAVQIAKPVLMTKYEKGALVADNRFFVTLYDGVWTVSIGEGDMCEVRIDKKTGELLNDLRED